MTPPPDTYVPDSEEDERRGEQQSQHVTEGRERERHVQSGERRRDGGRGGCWEKSFTGCTAAAGARTTPPPATPTVLTA